MDAPDSAQANTLALPDARPAITLGQALPFALAFEARRRQAADERAARKLARLENTVRRCEELRARLAALCDAATRIDANAARELMLGAARGASRARGEPREGRREGLADGGREQVEQQPERRRRQPCLCGRAQRGGEGLELARDRTFPL